jgi:HEAT repeat protein
MGRARLFVLVGMVSLAILAPALAQTTFQDEIANLRSPNTGTRVKAAQVLGKSGRPEAIPALTEATRDPELKVRKTVVAALRSFNSSETVDGLLVALRDDDKNIRNDAMVALLEIYVGAGNADMGGSFDWIIGSRKRTPVLKGLVPVDSRVVEGLESRLQDEEPDLRQRAAYSLGVLDAPDAVDTLGAALYDPEKKVRLQAIEALGKIGSNEAGEALRGALRDGSGDIAAAAVDALGDMRYLPAAPELVSIYDANVNKLGDRALTALALMGAPEARGVFYYQMTSSNAQRRRWAAEGLGRLDDESLVPGLMKDFLREPDPSVQLAYCFSLSRLGQVEFIDRIALSLGNKKLRDQAHDYAVELGSPLLEELVSYLSDPVADVRKEMALVLMEIGDERAIPYLEPLLSDPNAEVADWANRAIARLQQGRRSAANAPMR